MVGLLCLVLVLAILGMPLFCVLGALGLIGLTSSGTTIVGGLSDLYSKLTGAEAISLSTIPLFTFAGYLMAKAKTAKRLVDIASSLLGIIPGGLALVTLWTCAFFTTFTGASGVTIVALGGLLLPELLKQKYPSRFALEVVTGSGAVGLLFPPALPLIVYGIVYGINAGASQDPSSPLAFQIERFYSAGIIPGFIILVILSVYCIVVGVRAKIPTTPLDGTKFGAALWEAKWELPIPFVILALLGFGWAVIPEVAALTALYVFIVEVFIYKDIDIKKDLFHLTSESMTLVGAIFMKIAAATILTAYFIDASIPERLFEWLSVYVHSSTSFLLVLNVVLLLVGCLMDIFSAIIVVVPLIVPAAAKFHINPYHLGIIFLINLEIGYLLPPAGLNLFIAAFRFNRPITQLYRAVIPFILLIAAALALITFVPQLVWVPKGGGAPAMTAPVP